MELQTIRLYGVLGAKFGRVFNLAVENAAEAISALCIQLPGFEKFLIDSESKGIGYSVFYGKKNLSKEELLNSNADKEIKIAPMLLGSKRGGIFQIIIGVVLVVVGYILAFTPFAAFSPILIKLGAGLIIGGLVQLLTPVPKDPTAKDKVDNKPSYTFNGPVNTQAQGNPFPLLYGRCIIGSAVLSAGINPVEQVYIPNNPPGGVVGGGGVKGAIAGAVQE